MTLPVEAIILSLILAVGLAGLADWLFDEASRRERRTFRGMDSPSRAAFWLRITAWACLAAAVLVLAVTGWIVWGMT